MIPSNFLLQLRNPSYILISQSNISLYKHFFLFRFPWNSKTPVGYLPMIIIQFFWLYGGAFLAITTLLTFAGICMLFSAFPKDIKVSFNDIGDSVTNVHGNFTVENCADFYKRLSDIAELHSTAKEFSYICYLVDRF